MQSFVFQAIGLGNLDIFWIFLGILLIFVVVFILIFVQRAKFKELREKYEVFMSDGDGKSLESEFKAIFNDIRTLKKNTKADRKDIEILIEKMHSCYQKMGLVKYDAFHEMGGKLSFSICMLDEGNNGFIINSVHSNTGCYTYTKEIKDGKSEIELGDGEKIALDQAVSGNDFYEEPEET